MQHSELLIDYGHRPQESSRDWSSRAAMVSFACLLLLGMSSTTSSRVWADSPQQANDPQTIADLVMKLSAPSFRERRQAEADCRDTGPAAIPALMKALQSPDPELRRRAQQLIEQIEEDGLSESIEAFLTPGSSTTLPGWSLVADLVEDTQEFRTAYAGILRGNSQLAHALSHPDLLSTELQRQLQNMGMPNGSVPQGISTVNASAILLLLIHPEATHPADAASLSVRTIRQGVVQGVNETASGQLLQALLTRWVVTSRAGTAFDRLSVAWQLSLPESVTPALEMLEQQGSPHQLQIAFLAIIRFGGAPEMAVVETRLNDAQVLNIGRGPDNQPNGSTQLRDQALLTLIAMNKQDPTQFGLKALTVDASKNVTSVVVSFETEAQREAAFEKWRIWSAKNLRKYRALPRNAEEGTSL